MSAEIRWRDKERDRERDVDRERERESERETDEESGARNISDDKQAEESNCNDHVHLLVQVSFDSA